MICSGFMIWCLRVSFYDIQFTRSRSKIGVRRLYSQNSVSIGIYRGISDFGFTVS